MNDQYEVRLPRGAVHPLPRAGEPLSVVELLGVVIAQLCVPFLVAYYLSTIGGLSGSMLSDIWFVTYVGGGALLGWRSGIGALAWGDHWAACRLAAVSLRTGMDSGSPEVHPDILSGYGLIEDNPHTVARLRLRRLPMLRRIVAAVLAASLMSACTLFEEQVNDATPVAIENDSAVEQLVFAEGTNVVNSVGSLRRDARSPASLDPSSAFRPRLQ